MRKKIGPPPGRSRKDVLRPSQRGRKKEEGEKECQRFSAPELSIKKKKERKACRPRR